MLKESLRILELLLFWVYASLELRELLPEVVRAQGLGHCFLPGTERSGLDFGQKGQTTP